MNLVKICNEIMNCDDQIIMVAVSHRTEVHYIERKGTTSLQTKAGVEKSLADAALRWVTRRSNLTLGEPLYAMAKYEKVKRVTVPLGHYGIILCAISPDADTDMVATKIIKIAKKQAA